MNPLRGRARIAAGTGLAVAAAVTTVMALVAGPAQAVERGKCTDTVNVREKPDLNAPVVGKCASGNSVSIDERKNGFVHLTSPKGWASEQFVKTTEGSANPSSSAARAPRNNTAPSSSAKNGQSAQQPSADPAPEPEKKPGLGEVVPSLLR